MKKKLVVLPLLLLLLAGCTPNDIHESESESHETPSSGESTKEDSSSTGGHSSSESSSEETPSSGDSSSSEQPIQYKTNIGEMRSIAAGLSSSVNEKNVATSNIKARFTAQILTVQDYITTQNGYTNRYKAFVANDTGYIVVCLSLSGYDYVKGYADKQQCYTFEGNIGLYCGEPEIVMDSSAKPTYLSGTTLTYTLEKTAVSTISDAFNFIKTIPVNSKGIGFSSTPVTMELKYISKLENAVALFSDGTNVIQIHGHDKINNQLSLGGVYEVTGLRGIFNYKSELEFIGFKAITKTIEVDYSSVTNLTAAQLYAYDYDLDHAYSSNYEYAEQFTKIYRYVGYANYYIKGSNYSIVFDDSAKDYYNTITNAITGKSVFLNNDNSVNLYTEADIRNCPFMLDAAKVKAEKVLISFYFTPYLRNTTGYWQIQVFEDTVQYVL